MDATVRHLHNVGQGLEEDFIVGIGLVRTSAEVALALVVIADCPLEVLVEAIAKWIRVAVEADEVHGIGIYVLWQELQGEMVSGFWRRRQRLHVERWRGHLQGVYNM